MKQAINILGRKPMTSPVSPSKLSINYSKAQKREFQEFKENFAKALVKAFTPKSKSALRKSSCSPSSKRNRTENTETALNEDSPELKRNKILKTFVSKTISMRTKEPSEKEIKLANLKQEIKRNKKINDVKTDGMLEIKLIKKNKKIPKKKKINTSIESIKSSTSNSSSTNS